MKGRLLFLFALGIAAEASASNNTVVAAVPSRRLVSISDPDPSWLKPPDQVCLLENDIKVTCGEVLRVKERGFIMVIARGKAKFKRGDRVEVVRDTVDVRSRYVAFGANYLFPQVHFEQLFAPRLSYGVMVEAISLSKGSKSMKGFATVGNISYYGSSLFSGPWVMAGVGVHVLNLSEGTARNGITSVIAQLNLGWKLRLSRALLLGVAVGGQYFVDKNLHPLTLASGVLPSVVAEVGFAF